MLIVWPAVEINQSAFLQVHSILMSKPFGVIVGSEIVISVKEAIL